VEELLGSPTAALKVAQQALTLSKRRLDGEGDGWICGFPQWIFNGLLVNNG